MSNIAKTYRIYPLAEAVSIGIGTFICIFITTYFIYHYAITAQKGEIKEGLLRTAKVVSTAINTDVLETFVSPDQQTSVEYKNALIPLEKTLIADDTIEYLYTALMRDNKVYFILDATPAGDADGDGVEDKAFIMDEYSEAGAEIIQALNEQIVVISEEPYTDRWGSFMSGFIPLYNSQGKCSALIKQDTSIMEYNLIIGV